ncbi:3-keto-5-aminohexanoate cleavage protein [Ancylobacter sonchi]|uniref:3-keto-5-aminohexanoate cleavage protein n=1 Tax=Ancylobacter sonchi TaxID=1937790 RepID=UPI001BD5C7B9|nr:3-keto-5-aminohexanoate cleavage protein [Ancylobacter sonchi]MBS7532482.1 3-keto-5-aminohexanoate cleavage protein [Ancylobacter sonchi]
MAAKRIISVAVTGNQTTLKQHPGLPCTPRQIADACIESAKAGAAIAHIHVRYEDGRPSMELDHYREVVDRIRSSSTDVLINLTTGPGQRFVPSPDQPSVAAPGTTLVHPLRRVEHIIALKPDICSLDLNTMWSGSAVVINTPTNVKIMAEAIYEAGTKPELEVFDSGDINLALALLKEGVLKSPPLFQIVTGIQYGFAGTPESLFYARSLLPPDAQWAAFGIGRMAFPMVAQAYLLGGHVRVGLEDAINIRKGELAASNAQMVEKAVRILDDLGAEIATVDEARDILGLKK